MPTPAEPTGFALVRHWWAALYAAKLSPAERDTLCALASHMTTKGIVQIPRTAIVEMTGRNRGHVEQHIAKAIRAGILEILEPASRGNPTTYRMTVPEVFESRSNVYPLRIHVGCSNVYP